MTALDAVADRVQGIKAGAGDFLTKPVHEEELLARIETALKVRHTVDHKIGALKEHFAKFVRLVMTPDVPSAKIACFNLPPIGRLVQRWCQAQFYQ